ncbi:MAG TPA: dihydrofolate reductase [Solimonas sp.]|nr:dihydrofolate reductase [Solimonas sp.]
MSHPPAAPIISLVAAMDQRRLIGRSGQLPWRLPKDLQHFKALTLGKTVLMGRKTWDSLFIQPLPQRQNWVLSRDPKFVAPGARVFHDLGEALAEHQAGELVVIGGADLYRQTLDHAQRIYLTEVEAEFHGGDAWFPALDAGQWIETQREAHAADERHAHAYRFVTLERSVLPAAAR